MVTSGVRKSGYLFEYRFTLLGDARCGKTSVLNRFISGTFSHRYRPTLEDHVTHIMEHNGNMCVCVMVDMCGGNDFPAMRRLAISKGNALFVFYSIDDRASFRYARQLVKEIRTTKDEETRVFVVGNKSDLKRAVKEHEGEQLACELRHNKNIISEFFEVSAKDNSNIDLIFHSMLNSFVPYIAVDEVKPERSAFSRMSLRRKSHKDRKNASRSSTKSLRDNKPTNYFSDDDILSRQQDHTVLRNTPSAQLLRSSSCGNDLNNTSDSDSGVDTSPKISPKTKKRMNILKKTFGSMTRLFKPEHEETRYTTKARSNTLDSLDSLNSRRKHTTI